jgi:NAD(P)H dehydrogenase (quinone)
LPTVSTSVIESNTMNKILVTGATGKLGTLAIDALLKRVPATQVIAGVRNLEKASALKAKGVEVRLLDYTKPETAPAALVGVDRVLLISSSEGMGERAKHHATVIDAAKQAGVKLLAYTSILRGTEAKVMLSLDHQATEKALRASGVPHVLLRNGWYIENQSDNLGGALASGVMLGSAGDGAFAPAARADFAEAAAVVLTTEGHAGKAYELAGDTSLTMTQLAAEVARLSGKPVRYQDLPDAEYAATLQKFGVPAGFAQVLADADAGVRRGELNDTSRTLSTLLGRPTTPVATVLAKALGVSA